MNICLYRTSKSVNRRLCHPRQASCSSAMRLEDEAESHNTNNGSRWRAKIGLEIHAQILASSKLFSVSPTAASLPNAAVSNYFDVAMPGTLPQLNKQVVHQAIKAALACGCSINNVSIFERKHYYYQDLPLGYQITQQRQPIAVDGLLSYSYLDQSGINAVGSNSSIGAVRVQRIQIEQDSGKTLHDADKFHSLVDFNRAGVGLIEIVFAPDLEKPEQAAGLLKTVQELLRHIGVCDGNLENGSMRCDVNISVESSSSSTAGTGVDSSREKISGNRVEVKNLNSMQRVIQAAHYEIKRQIDLLETNGQVVQQETRGFDVKSGETYRMRTKEAAVDYRYFPDPDLPPLFISNGEIEAIAKELPELPNETFIRLKGLGLDDQQSQLLISKQGVKFFETTLHEFIVLQKTGSKADDSEVALFVFNWISSELMGFFNNLNLNFQTSILSPKQFSELLFLVSSEGITKKQAKKLLVDLFTSESCRGLSPKSLAEERGLFKKSIDEDAVEAICVQVVTDPTNVSRVAIFKKAGNDRALQFFMGDIMKKTQGQVNPQTLRTILLNVLNSQP